MISIFFTSIRPHLWPSVYYSFTKATTRPFEVVVTSPFSHPESLPPNFRLIRTDVKPAQALEAAAWSCKGDMIMGTTDDLFFDPGAIDAMAKVLETQGDVLASARYYVGDRNEHCYHEGGAVGYTGLVPLCPLMRRADWFVLGGSDPCFCSSYAQDDLLIRLLVAGWKTVLVDQRLTEMKHDSDLWNTSGNVDLEIIRGLWCEGKTFTGKRAKPNGVYDYDKILTENQGHVRGSQATRWK
jgi:hypothetical protein